MIKCNVTVCGTISRTAQMRTGKEGKPFMSFGINVVIPAKSGINKTVEISVAKDGGSQEELANYPVGNRVEVVALPARVVDAYNQGALPLNTLANAVLAKNDQMRQIAAENYAASEQQAQTRTLAQR